MENNEKQQLALIAEMINSARQDFSDDSIIYLLWGWSVCLASLAQYVLLKMDNIYNGAVWLVLIPVGIFQGLYFARAKKTEKVKTHLDRVIGYVWISVGLSLGIVLATQSILQLHTFPVLIVLYGIGTFISGGIMRFKPMQYGALCCWVIALAALHVVFEYQLLLLSLSLIVSYIIPGHLLKIQFRKNV